MLRACRTIARFTFQEALRNRLFLLTLVGLVCVLGLTEFVGELAITETDKVQAILIASAMRWFAVVTVALFVITSMVREFHDKGADLITSLALPRSAYYAGKFLGFNGLALVIALATSILLTIYAPLAAVSLWFLSLVCELALVVALSLLCLFTLNNVTVAFMAVAGFYILARSMYTIRLITESPVLEFYTFSQQFMNTLVDSIAFVLPGLHAFTRSEWLAYGVSWLDLQPVLVQAVIYTVLLVCAGLFDLYRRNF